MASCYFLLDKNRKYLIKQRLKFVCRHKFCEIEWKILVSFITFDHTCTLCVYASMFTCVCMCVCVCVHVCVCVCERERGRERER